MGLQDNLRRLVSESGMSMRRISERAGASPDLVKDILNGKSQNPRADHLAGIAAVLGTTVEALLLGSDMAPPRRSVAQCSIVSMENQWTVPRDFLPPAARQHAPSIQPMTVEGDAMEPGIPDGSTVLVDTSIHQPIPAGVFAIAVPGGAVTFRRLICLPSKDAPRVQVTADNPVYPTERVGFDELEILGRVCAVFKVA